MVRLALVVLMALGLLWPNVAMSQPFLGLASADARNRPIYCDASGINCTSQESWVWHRVFANLEADLEKCPEFDCGTKDSRILRPRVLRALLLRASHDPAVGARGITIRHAIVCQFEPNLRTGAHKIIEEPCAENALRRNYDKKISGTDYRNIFYFPLDFPDLNYITYVPLDLRDLNFNSGVEILESTFSGDVQLGGAHFEQVLNLDGSRFWGNIDAYRLRVDGGMTVVGANIDGSFEGDNLRTAGTTNFFKTIIKGAMHLRNARLDHDLDFGNIWVFGPQDAKPATPPRSSVELPRSAIDLSNAHISGQLYGTGAWVPNANVDLSGISVSGSIWLENTTQLDCGLKLERAHIDDDLMLGGGQFYQVDLTAAQIGHELRLENNGLATSWVPYAKKWAEQYKDRFKNCNAKNESPQKEPADRDVASWLVMRNSQIFAIRDKMDGWPDCLTLTGLNYSRPPQDLSGAPRDPRSSGLELSKRECPGVPQRALPWWHYWQGPYPQFRSDGEKSDSAALRTFRWWQNWLGRDPQLAGQSFVQLATALDAIGEHDAADDIKYERHRFEISKTTQVDKKILLFIEEGFVGFGVGTYALRALIWTVIFVSISAFFLHCHLIDLKNTLTEMELAKDEKVRQSYFWCILASLQEMLPFITLSKGMKDFLHEPLIPGKPETRPLHGGIAIWFMVLAIIGLVLSGFLLQGLRSYSGL